MSANTLEIEARLLYLESREEANTRDVIYLKTENTELQTKVCELQRENQQMAEKLVEAESKINKLEETRLSSLDSNLEQVQAAVACLRDQFSRQQMGSDPSASSASKTTNQLYPSISGATDQSGPSSSSPSHQTGWKLLSHKDKKRLIKATKFEVWTGYEHVHPIKENQTILVKDYSKVVTGSEFMDVSTGRFKTPVQGRFRFEGELRIKGVGEVSLFVCGSDGKRVKVVSIIVDGNSSRGDDTVEWDCPEGMDIWLEVEAAKVPGNVGFDAFFKGILLIDK